MIPICGALTLSPVRARKNDFVGGAVVSPFSSGAASWAKLVTVQHKQSRAASFKARMNAFKVTELPRWMNTQNDTSFVVFRGGISPMGRTKDISRQSLFAACYRDTGGTKLFVRK